MLLATAAWAGEMQAPHIAPAQVDWPAAAAALSGGPAGDPAQAFAKLNEVAAARFAGIGKSPVPVLMPFDVAGLGKTLGQASAEQPAPPDIADRFVLAGFHASNFFLAGPSGYDAAFSLRTADVSELSDIRYRDPVYVMLSGFRMLYRLDGPPLPEGEPVKELEAEFPGIRRYLHENYLRYGLERYGVTYVAAIYCQDRRPRPRLLTCHQADRIAARFLRALRLAGGSPQAEGAAIAPAPLDRPEPVSKDFTYYSPGFLIPGTGRRPDLPGRADDTVYARLRFPLKEAPDFANSQSFNNWGDCDFTGRSPRRLGQKGMLYSCKVNGLPLKFDESAGANYSYPWRDNFCEHRRFFVGQCAGGEGHQGQDIRPSYCKQYNAGADRCEPYQHEVVAAQDGTILRPRKQEAIYLFVNTTGAHLRLRYIHMSPRQLDAAGVLSGKVVHEGEALGRVGNYNEHERGTTYHLHFDMQVPTKVGWVFVNPYMTLVAAYERLIGARGTEIRRGDPAPAMAGAVPLVDRIEPALRVAGPAAAAPRGRAPTQENAAVRVKKPTPRGHRHAHRTHRHRHWY